MVKKTYRRIDSMDIFKILKRMPNFSKFMMNRYAPLKAAKIKIDIFRPSEGYVKVKMPLTSSNKNIVGVHFGGSLYAMVDPFFMLILMEQLGHEYIVWDKAATINFISPGRGEVYAEFTISPDEINQIRKLAENYAPVFRNYQVDIMDLSGHIIAKVDKTLYIKRKQTQN